MKHKNLYRLLSVILLTAVLNMLSAKGEGDVMHTRIFVECEPDPVYQPVLERLKNSPWCWGIEVSGYPEAEAVAPLYEDFDHVLVRLDANPTARKSEAAYSKKELPDPDAALPMHRRLAAGRRGTTLWLGIMENDSAGTRFPQELLKAKPKTHAEAKAAFDGHIQAAMQEAERYKELPLWGVFGYASSAHRFAAHGLDCLMVERTNDDVEDLQTGVAFTRGAARQYGRQWGVDISLWWGPIYGCVQDMEYSFHRRNLYAAYFSGAQAYRLEGGHLFYNAAEKKFNRIVELFDEFGRFTQAVAPGTPDVPAAVMLPSDHGWMTPPYWQATRTVWNYARIPYRQGQRALDGLFGLAFPGTVFAMQPFPFGRYHVDDPPASPFALTCIDDYFAPSPEDVYKVAPPLPFGLYQDRNIARQTIENNNLPIAPYRPMGDSRWGDIIDVLTDDASSEVLAGYKVLILADQIKLTSEIKQKLAAFAAAGGQVVMAVGVAAPDDRDLTGVAFRPEYRVGRAWRWGKQPFVHEAYHYVPAEASEGKVLATSDTGEPLAVRKDHGKGAVYTCLIPWYEGGHSDIAGAAQQLFDEVIGSVQPVRVEGLPIQYISTAGDKQRTVVALNHREKPWTGTITLADPAARYKKCTELLTSKPVKFKKTAKGLSCTIDIGAYDVVALRFEP